MPAQAVGARPHPERSGGARPLRPSVPVLLEGDFHAPTRFSDGFLSPPELVLHARRRGLHVLAVTEHNLVFPAKIARWFARATCALSVVIVGEEVTTAGYHVHGTGLERAVVPTRDIGPVIDAAHAQGGLVIAAHPTRRFWSTLTKRGRVEPSSRRTFAVLRGIA